MMPRVPMDDQYLQSTTAGSGSGSSSGHNLNHGGHISNIHQPTTMNHPQGQVNLAVFHARVTASSRLHRFSPSCCLLISFGYQWN